MVKQNKEWVVGIDLGTTYSCVVGSRTTPSCVAFIENQRLIGDVVKNQAAMNPTNTLFGAQKESSDQVHPKVQIAQAWFQNEPSYSISVFASISGIPSSMSKFFLFLTVSRSQSQVTMVSSSPVYAFFDSEERQRSDSPVVQPVVAGSIESLLSGDRVFVSGGVDVDVPEDGCSSSPAEYLWASREVGEQGTIFVSREILLGWVENNCILRTLGYNRSLRLIACRKDERVFHEEDVVGGNYFYIYLYSLYDMYIRLPFTRFQMDVLRCLNVAPSQLHPNGCGYIQAFGVLCQALGIEPTTKIFLFFFKTRPNAKRGWVSLSSMSKNSIFNLFVESYKDFKNHFFKVSITEMGQPFFLNENGSPRFPLYWTKKPRTLTSWPLEDMTDVERRNLDELVGLPRPFSSRKMINCLKYNDLKSRVSDRFLCQIPSCYVV
ncbi:hypothetical protein V8G54_017963 [Vigna mungo]|uniref:Transposase (putative) gypsy type domain-containing protein n=1 Tax=Vigna mungo TaxID=3915 RepID=A0AAQ3N814_VIGMU